MSKVTETRFRAFGEEEGGKEGIRSSVVETNNGMQAEIWIGNMEDNYEQTLLHLDPMQLIQLEMHLVKLREELMERGVGSWK